jgi:hypothetical protein
MKIWHKLADTDLGPIVFRWRHCNKSRFYNKIFSWILASFMMGMLTSIVFAFLGIYNQALYFSRIVFFITLVVGLINSWFIHAVFGLEFRLTQKAFVAVRPLLGWLPWAEKLRGADKPLGARFEYLSWEEIKEAREQDGDLVLVLKKNLEEVRISVAPVAWVNDGTRIRLAEKPVSGKTDNLDRETLKTILLKIRDLKKLTSVKS